MLRPRVYEQHPERILILQLRHFEILKIRFEVPDCRLWVAVLPTLLCPLPLASRLSPSSSLPLFHNLSRSRPAVTQLTIFPLKRTVLLFCSLSKYQNNTCHNEQSPTAHLSFPSHPLGLSTQARPAPKNSRKVFRLTG